MSKEQVMDYVMNSPANTNPNVLSGMLDGISGTQLPSPTESDNGKVLGVDGGEYKLVEQTELPSPLPADEGTVVTVMQNGKYGLKTPSEPTFSVETLTGGYAFKYGKLAIVTYIKDGISFPSMMNGGLKPMSNTFVVDESVLNSVSMPVLGYGVDASDATKKYAVTYGTTPQGKAFYLIDSTGNSPSSQVFFWGTFFVPCV